jgi:hypothetical protein
VLKLPGEKAFASISGPKCAVAIEGGDARLKAEYALNEFSLPGRENGHEGHSSFCQGGEGFSGRGSSF